MGILSDQLRGEVRRKVSQFILSEAGRVGYRNAFSMAALVTASSLAAMMLSVYSVKAEEFNCGDKNCATEYCCIVQEPGGNWVYKCSNESPYPGGQPSHCWPI